MRLVGITREARVPTSHFPQRIITGAYFCTYSTIRTLHPAANSYLAREKVGVLCDW